MKIIPLSEGSFTIDKTKLFVPFDEDTHELNERPRGSLLVEVQPFAIQTSKDIILLDTGLGFEDKAGGLQIHRNLQAAGIHPNDITKVLLTHLHKDHAGGISFGKDHQWLSFSNATYYVHEKEMAYAFEKGLPSYIPDEIEALHNSPQLKLISGEEGVIDDYIFYKRTGAHSAHHQVFWIKEDGQTIFFGGDDAPQLQQMKIRYKTKYDHDPALATELREQWWEQGKKEGWTFLFYHDIRYPMYPEGDKVKS